MCLSPHTRESRDIGILSSRPARLQSETKSKIKGNNKKKLPIPHWTVKGIDCVLSSLQHRTLEKELCSVLCLTLVVLIHWPLIMELIWLLFLNTVWTQAYHVLMSVWLCLPALLLASEFWCPKEDMRHLQGRGPSPYRSQCNLGFPAHSEVRNPCFYATDSRMFTLKQNIVRIWQKVLFQNCQSHNRCLAGNQNGCILDLGCLWNQALLRM